VAVYPGWTAPLIRANLFGIRSSKTLFPQLSYYPQLQASLGSEAIKGLITPLESSLTRSPLATPLEFGHAENARGKGYGSRIAQRFPSRTQPISKSLGPLNTCFGAPIIKATPLRSQGSSFEVEFSLVMTSGRPHTTFRRIA
jgi:hypothetical protein